MHALYLNFSLDFLTTKSYKLTHLKYNKSLCGFLSPAISLELCRVIFKKHSQKQGWQLKGFIMGRVALVTGGTKGIGAAIAKELKSQGYTVAVNYATDDQKAQEFFQETSIKAYKWDVGCYDSCQKGLEEVAKDYGDIDTIINNAGITRDGMFHKMTVENWRKVLSVNLDSLFNITSQVIPKMRAKQFGRIINISSINGLKGQLGQVNYSTAKAGVLGFTKALALENANKNITVNAVTPGYIKTDMVSCMKDEVLQGIIKEIPVGRLGEPEEIAKLVCFLASDHAGFITGATINANGGQYCQ